MAMANTRADHLPIPGGLLQGNLTVQRQRDLFPLLVPAFPLAARLRVRSPGVSANGQVVASPRAKSLLPPCAA